METLQEFNDRIDEEIALEETPFKIRSREFLARLDQTLASEVTFTETLDFAHRQPRHSRYTGE